MVKLDSLQLHKFVYSKKTEFALNKSGIQNKALSWVMDVNESRSVAEINATSDTICLNLEKLKCFEVVKNQYQEFGIEFENCIAIQPSNPAFPTRFSSIVLMAAPKNGFMEATFTRPICEFSAFVTSSQQLVLSAYGRDRKLLDQSTLPCANLNNSDSKNLPNTKLTVKAQNIQHITFRAFDGQFTIDDLSFCF
ncbi:hypothetical protein [Calothrix sp. PCC 6303]|uniref:hypothetical protein n=1 Tax=Calothrix sp. PCC 6303 TaxID=1170562 RepID=UPI0002A01A93|nr:hypothetical protein [Calothrix sp. PCC 6303]AFZ00123.1 hypothetical protein Cal6303_1060 [Calothrix sp. PCC 6303]